MIPDKAAILSALPCLNVRRIYFVGRAALRSKSFGAGAAAR